MRGLIYSAHEMIINTMPINNALWVWFPACPLLIISEGILYSYLSFGGTFSVRCPEVVRISEVENMAESIGGTLPVRYMEAVHISECPLWGCSTVHTLFAYQQHLLYTL